MMKRKKRLKLYFIFILTIIAFLIGYSIYLLITEKDYQALNADNIARIQTNLGMKENFTFAVVGNIRNSMLIFTKRIYPLIERNKADFIVSVGNAVYDGAEGKYRLLYRGLKKLDIPYVLAAGQNEVADFGAGKFYRHFGPYFFSFHLRNTDFIFLDSTGETSVKCQLRWLKEELAHSKRFRYRFVFMNHSPFPLPGFEPDDNQYVLNDKLSGKLQDLFTEYEVTAVFSAGYPTFYETERRGVRYIVSGGSGGLLLNRWKPYQFVKVTVRPNSVDFENIDAVGRMGSFRERLETLKLYLHSFFYMSLFNFLVFLSLFGLTALKLYSLIIHQEHLYRDFNVDEDALSKKKLRVAMFTDNYLPFIGGVPLSINRLYRGLIRKGSAVRIFAPAYPGSGSVHDDGDVFRCPTFFYTSEAGYPVANVFSREIDNEFTEFDCDLVHVHHPLWLGRKGMRLGKKHDLPVVLTYHTRLDRYIHYFPFPGDTLKILLAHFLIKRFANRCDAIIAPTSATEEYLRNLGVSALIETIPTGIDMKDYKRYSSERIRSFRRTFVDHGEFLLISVSRLAKEKNMDFLIDGLSKVKKQSDIPFRCLLVGDGPERKRLEERVAGLGMTGQIIFTGNVPPHKVALYYLASDIFVFASTSETQGMVLVEAMAGGCPVVAVRASGVHDIVKDGYTGLMVSESTDRWAKVLAGLMADRGRLTDMAENCRTFAEDYSMENITGQVLKLYRRVIVLAQSKNV